MTPLYVNARFLTQPTSGVQRYARQILGALDELLARDRSLAARIGPVQAFYPATTGATLPRWRMITPVALRGARGHGWEQSTLWRASRDGVLISLCNAGPLLHRRQVLTLHDANLYVIPDAFAPAYRRFHKVLRPMLARRAARLTTVSTFSAEELARCCRVAQNRFTIIPNAADHLDAIKTDVAAVRRHGLKPGGYLLTVGNQSPNKNVAKLVEAHAASDASVPPLAVVGGFVPGVARDALHSTDRVRVLGRVSDGELKALYASAWGFVWPSLYEGFGIPPLEAMWMGTPVLASDSSAMPGVLDDAAQYMNARSVRSMTAALNDFGGMSPAVRAEWGARGIARAEEFTWIAAARRLIALASELQAPQTAAPASAGRVPPLKQKDPSPHIG